MDEAIKERLDKLTSANYIVSECDLGGEMNSREIIALMNEIRALIGLPVTKYISPREGGKKYLFGPFTEVND